MFYAGFLVFAFFSQMTLGKKIAQSFLSTAKFITKYSLERFLFAVRKYI